MAATALAMTRSSLKAGMITVTGGGGDPAGSRGRRRRNRCTSASGVARRRRASEPTAVATAIHSMRRRSASCSR